MRQRHKKNHSYKGDNNILSSYFEIKQFNLSLKVLASNQIKGCARDRQAGRQAGRQADRQTDRQADRQTDILSIKVNAVALCASSMIWCRLT